MWIAHQFSRRIWVRASLFSLAAVITALLAAVVSPYIPADLPTNIGGDAVDKILGIIVGDVRSFDQDPRFGAVVLTEIASRALSPGMNDPGTAIDVIGRAVRLLAICIAAQPGGPGARRGRAGDRRRPQSTSLAGR
jgi:hypothetical protein